MAVTDADLIHAITQLPSPFDSPLTWQPTEFEKMLEKLGLIEEECTESADVRAWCGAHKNTYYVPEWLLRHFKLEVSHDKFGEDTPTCQVLPI
jgi:hypothetical protein